jgi:hypothetical protein
LIVVSHEKRNGICPKNCSCAILYKEVIEVALKDLCDHFWQESEYPSYDQHMVAACDVFWEARMEQMCCQLDKNVALPPCILKLPTSS